MPVEVKNLRIKVNVAGQDVMSKSPRSEKENSSSVSVMKLLEKALKKQKER